MTEEISKAENSSSERPNKVFHMGNFDVVVPKKNLSDDIYGEAEKITAFIGSHEIDEIEYCGTQEYERRHFIYPQGETDSNKTYFIKRKKVVDPETLGNLRKNAKEYGYQALENKNRLTAISSVLNEINNGPLITEVLESIEIKNLAKQYGLSDIKLISPIFAIADRQTGHKYLAYPDRSDLCLATTNQEIGPKMANIKDDLLDVFIELGISPQDYGVGQFLYSKENNTLYLIDTEAWFKTKQFHTNIEI
jgi:hypothetical protein